MIITDIQNERETKGTQMAANDYTFKESEEEKIEEE